MVYTKNQRYKTYLGTREILLIMSEKTGIPISELELPYISIYYYNPKPYNDENVTIPMYFSDFYQSEYNLDNKSLRFKLRYELDGVVNYIENLPAGDFELDLGALTTGKHWFSLQVEDEYGRISRRIYHEVLSVDRATYDITSDQVYTITDSDLTQYQINKNNSDALEDMINNRVGLTNLFAHLQSRGYRKVVLPDGIYRINRCLRDGTVEKKDCPITIPTRLIVDMNGATFKLHPYDDREYGNKAQVENLMVRMVDCFDSHLVNGTLEGDFFERRDELTWDLGDGKTENAISGGNGEHNNTFIAYGGEFCSLDNVTIKQTTGYNMTTIQNGNIGNIQSIKTWFENTAVNDEVEITKEGYVTSDFVEISQELLDNHYIVASVWLALGGLTGMYWDMDFHFYNNSKQFIDTIKVYQYTRCRIPEGAKYCKVTLKGTIADMDNLVLHYMKVPKYFSCNNCHWIDNRTCANPTQGHHCSIINCDFTRTGQSITPCEIDLEDGWEQLQDLFVKGCIIHENVGTADVIDNAGINHVYENNVNMNFLIRYRCNGVVIRNNKNSGISLTIGWMTGNSIRTYGNEFNTRFSLGETEKNFWGNDKIKLRIKNNKLLLGSVNCNSPFYEIIDNDVEITGYTENLHLKDCRVVMSNNNAYMLDNVVMSNCTLGVGGDLTQMKFSFNMMDAKRRFIHCTFKNKVWFTTHNYFNSGYWSDCIFDDAVSIDLSKNMTNDMGSIQFNNCTFKSEVSSIIRNEKCYVQFNNCIFEKPPVFLNYGEVNTEFNDCRIPE